MAPKSKSEKKLKKISQKFLFVIICLIVVVGLIDLYLRSFKWSEAACVNHVLDGVAVQANETMPFDVYVQYDTCSRILTWLRLLIVVSSFVGLKFLCDYLLYRLKGKCVICSDRKSNTTAVALCGRCEIPVCEMHTCYRCTDCSTSIVRLRSSAVTIQE